MPKNRPKSAKSLRDILLIVHRRACVIRESVRRRAAAMAADAEDRGLSSEERDKLLACGRGDLEVDEIRKVERLRNLAGCFLDKAERAILREEAKRLGSPIHRKTLLPVACEAFMRAAEQVAGHRMHESYWHDLFCNYLWWLDVASHDPRSPGEFGASEDLVVAGQELDTPEFLEEFLETLWRECPEECKDLKFRKPMRSARPGATGTFSLDRSTLRSRVIVENFALTIDGRRVAIGKNYAWAAFNALWKNQSGSVEIDKERVRRLKEKLTGGGADWLADAIKSDRSGGYYLDFPD